MTTFVVWNDSQGNSNLDPPPNVKKIYDCQVVIDGPDGDGVETISIYYNSDRVVTNDVNR